VVRDLVAFSARYDTSEILVAGQYSGRLNNDGERLELNAPINQEVLNWRYDRDEVPGTQGLGHSITYGLPGFSWGTGQPSAVYLGTPGRPPEARHEGPVVVNEVLANSDNGAGEVDAVELLNTSTAPIDIGDWQLMSNNGFVQIAAGTTLLPGEYHVVSLDVYSEVHDHQGDNAHEFFHDYCGYRMDLFGEFFVDNDLLLVGVLPGDSEPTVVDYIHQIRPVERGVTVGRLPNGDGPLAPNASNTLGSPNSEPLLQAVVVSELMYNPPGDDFFGNEFLELYNASISTENFFVRIDVDDDTLRPGYSPLEMTIAPGEAITLSQRDYNGQLSNGGERLRVLREGAIVAYPTEFDVFQPVYVVDQVTYDDDPPWPESADGDGDSLHRFFPDWVGDDPASWYAAPPTPGAYQVGGGVLDRHIVYNDSAFDGNDPAASVADTAAIDPTKDALLPGQTAAPCNVSNYAAGINGIAIDLPNATAAISPTDFAFRVGNDDQPDAWGAPPPPTGFEFLPGQGTLDSDRVVIVWNDGSIVNTWLQVAVSANENTGLVAADVFYFGNAVGETGNDPNNALVTAADVIAVRDHPRGPANRAPIDDPHDVNRNGLVDAIDVLLARNAATGPFSALRLITPVTPVAPPPVEAVAEGERMMDRMPTASVGMAPGANSDHKGTQDTKKKRTG